LCTCFFLYVRSILKEELNCKGKVSIYIEVERVFHFVESPLCSIRSRLVVVLISIDPLAFRLLLILAFSLLQALLVSFEVGLTRDERNQMRFELVVPYYSTRDQAS